MQNYYSKSSEADDKGRSILKTVTKKKITVVFDCLHFTELNKLVVTAMNKYMEI